MDLAAYLDRIALGEVPAADAAGLATVQRAHRLAVPFENIDIVLGRGISLDPDAVFDKIVTRRRGGFCFEQNQLFLRALGALGFEAHPLLARVWLAAADDVPPRTHTLNLVTIDGTPWIADAGFGGGYIPPMPLTDQSEMATPDGAWHRLVADVDHGWMLYRRADETADWQAQYSFTADRVWPSDLALSSHWTATSPESRFTAQPFVTIVLPRGFASLIGRRYHRTTVAEKTEGEVNARVARLRLSLMFGIDLTAEEVAGLGYDG